MFSPHPDISSFVFARIDVSGMSETDAPTPEDMIVAGNPEDAKLSRKLLDSVAKIVPANTDIPPIVGAAYMNDSEVVCAVIADISVNPFPANADDPIVKDPFMSIYNIYTVKSLRNNRVAKSTIEACGVVARDFDCTQLRAVGVSQEHEKFFHSLGFEPLDGDSEGVLVRELLIRPPNIDPSIISFGVQSTD